MNDSTGKNTNASYAPFQKKKKPSPDHHNLSNSDKQIMKAMGLFANVLRNAKREAEETTVSATRKAELEAWIERHAAEIDAHIEVSNHNPVSDVGAAHWRWMASNEISGKDQNGKSRVWADQQSRSSEHLSVSV